MNKYTLDQVLREQKAKRKFNKWASKQLCIENIQFLDEVAAFKLKPNDFLAKEAERIYQIYISSKGGKTVNISGGCCQSIETQIKEKKFHRFLFDEAAQEVRALIASDALVRFNNSF